MSGPDSVSITDHSKLFSAFEDLTTNRRWNKGTILSTINFDTGNIELRCVNHHILKGNGSNVVTEEQDNELRGLLRMAVTHELRDSFDKLLRYAPSATEREKVQEKINEVIAKFDEAIFTTGVRDGKHEFKRSDIGRIVQDVTRLKDTMSVERLLNLNADELCTLASSPDSMKKAKSFSVDSNNYTRPANSECNARDNVLGRLDDEQCTDEVMVKAVKVLFDKFCGFTNRPPISKVQSDIDAVINEAKELTPQKGLKKLIEQAKTYLCRNEYFDDAVDPDLREKFETAVQGFKKKQGVGNETSLDSMVELFQRHKESLAKRELGFNRILKKFNINAFRLDFDEAGKLFAKLVEPCASKDEIKNDFKRLVSSLASVDHAMADAIGSLTRNDVVQCLNAMDDELKANLGLVTESVEAKARRKYDETVQQTSVNVEQTLARLDLGKVTVEKLFNASKKLVENMVPEQALIKKLRERRKALKDFLNTDPNDSQIKAEIDKLIKDVDGKSPAVEFKNGPSVSHESLRDNLVRLNAGAVSEKTDPKKLLNLMIGALAASINGRVGALKAKFTNNKAYSCLLEQNKNTTDAAGFVKSLKAFIMDCVTMKFGHDGVKPVIVLAHGEDPVVMDEYGNLNVKKYSGTGGFNLNAMLNQFVDEANAS